MNFTYAVIMVGLLYFLIGLLTVLFRRNLLIILMGLELMLNAGNFLLVSIGNLYRHIDGQVFVLVVLAIAAAEVALGLAIAVNLFRLRGSTNVDDFKALGSE